MPKIYSATFREACQNEVHVHEYIEIVQSETYYWVVCSMQHVCYNWYRPKTLLAILLMSSILMSTVT